MIASTLTCSCSDSLRTSAVAASRASLIDDQDREVVLKVYLLESTSSPASHDRDQERAEKERSNHQRIDVGKHKFLSHCIVEPFEFSINTSISHPNSNKCLIFVFPKYQCTLRDFMFENHQKIEYPLQIQSIARQLATYLDGIFLFFHLE
jgi:hypothetical protein